MQQTKMTRKKKFAIIAATCLIIYALIGFVAVPLMLESILPDKLSEALNRPVHIKNIRLNPFTLTAAIEGLDIKDKNTTDPFVSFDKLFINIQTLSIFKLGLVVKEVRLENPDIHLTRTNATEFNFSDLIPEKKPKAKTKPTDAETKPFHFSISNIAIINGNISLDDQTIQKQHIFSSITLSLPLISNFEKSIDLFSEPRLTGSFNHAGISIAVDTKPFKNTLQTVADIKLSGLDIPYYFSYIPKSRVGFDIPNGRLDIDAHISFLKNNHTPEITVSGTIGLSDLNIVEKTGDKLLTLPGLQITVAPSRPLEQQLTLAAVKIMSPQLFASWNKDGVINLTTLAPKPVEAAGDVESPSGQSTVEESTEEKPFIFAINDLQLDSGKIIFTDYAVTNPAANKPGAEPAKTSVDDLVIKLSDFSNAPEKTAAYDIHARINGEADISADGRLAVTPLSVDSDFNLAAVKLAWAQPYLPENIKLVITDGKLSASGHTTVHSMPAGEIRTTVTGKAAVNNFQSIDPERREPFIAWHTFSLNGIDISTNPLEINTDKILLRDFKNQVIVFNDGATNIQKIFVQPEPAIITKKKKVMPDAAEKASKPSVIPVKIGEVRMDNVDVQFIDKNIKPNFSTRLNLSKLRVTGLTSEDFKAAELTAEGKIDDYAPIKISGKMNPLKKDLFLDAIVSLSNMELSPLSPYTGKFIGRTIEKGKLSTDVMYKIDKKEVNAQNRVLVDQFTLGQTVESKDSLNLPVGLAISLLKDRNGQINIDLPVSGRTDDPDFGFGKPLLNALKTLIVKAATSPFDLVSSVVGGGEELRYIEFAPALAAIDDADTQKLDAVKKLMYERPGVKMEISGYVDKNADRTALIDRILARKIKTCKMGENAPEDMAAIDKIVLPPEEYEILLKQVYENEVLSDPVKKKTVKSLDDPTLTREEIENRIRSQISVPDAELRLLALDRARQVKNYLLLDGRITPDRLFLTEPKSLSPAFTEGFQAARVELDVR